MAHIFIADGASSFFNNIGGILTGVSELFAVLGAGVGFIVRVRKGAKREKLRTETAAAVAAQETKKALEAKLEAQHADAIQQYEKQLSDKDKAAAAMAVDKDNQIAQLKAQIVGLQSSNSHLLERILEGPHHD